MYVITGLPRVPAPTLALRPDASMTLLRTVLHQCALAGSTNASLAVRCVFPKLSPLIAAARSAKSTRSNTNGVPIAARSAQSAENSIDAAGNVVRRTYWFIEA